MPLNKRPFSDENGSGFQELREFLRLAAGILGLLAIVFGLYCAAKLFFAVKDGLQHPEQLGSLVEQWSEIVGGRDLTIALPEGELPLGRTVAISVLGTGSVVLVWIAFGFVRVGARLISWTLTDVEATKKLVAQIVATARLQAGQRQKQEAGEP